ncbi:serine--tRNA ligase, partial [Candidatus Nomurabacteria bacterium]|nr:serine--tRNA ligase [Candidatus Nomurabacteria bacterium]
MLDIKFIKENKDLIQEAARKKHVDFSAEELITLDEQRIQTLSLVESLRAEQNIISDKIPQMTDPVERQTEIEKMRLLKEDLKKHEDTLRDVMTAWQGLMLRVPNIPDMSVPDGDSDEDNVEVKVWGDKPAFDFEPKDHITLMET